MVETKPDLLKTSEVAELCRVNRQTVLRWSEDGSLPAPVRMGERTLRWRREDIERYIGRAPLGETA